MSGTTWNKAETLKLIAIWGEEHIQKKLQECKKNQSVYDEVAKEMKDSGYDRSYQQCRDKIKKLKGEYKKEKDRHEDTGEGRTTWEYFDAMDVILGHRPSTRPPIVIDSLDTDTVLSTQSSTQDKEEAESVEGKNESGSPSSLNSSTTSTPQAGGSGNQGRKRKRPSRMADSAVIDLLEQVITAQSKSDERMVEVEEKRLRMEERQMEREALQRREEREFQMQMMRMMMMGPGMHPLPPPPPPPPPPSHPRMHNDPSSSGSFSLNFETKDYPAFTRSFEDDQ